GRSRHAAGGPVHPDERQPTIRGTRRDHLRDRDRGPAGGRSVRGRTGSASSDPIGTGGGPPRGRRADRGEGSRDRPGVPGPDDPVRRPGGGRRRDRGPPRDEPMRPRSLVEVAAVVDGSVRGDGAVMVRGAAVDSREAGRGDLFVALPGEQVDGHDFVGDALAHGASAAMVRGDWRGRVEPTVGVADPGAALLRLARDERSTLSAQVVGITGSTGKTMTKDLTAAVLGRRFRVVASPASFNNEVGLPLTLLRADEGTEAVVCEMC